jgi:quercetin dioxygenase-like cupin family protein
MSRTIRAVCALLAELTLIGLPACERNHDVHASRATESIARTILERRPLAEMPGWEVRMVLIEYAPGVAAPPHRHPVAGYGYVVSGIVESAFGDDPPRVYRAGESFVDDADRLHRISRNVDPKAPLQLLLTYVIRTGEPNIIP